MSPARFDPRQGLLFVLAALAGAGIAWIDSRPHWDDTGITAGLVVVAAGVSTALGLAPVVAPLLVAAPLIAVALSHGNSGALLALPFAIAGAGIGLLVRRALDRGGAKAPNA